VKNPTVTIGLPVYNGERFVAQAIESILGQTYEDFELLISDNASTDETLSICRSYASNDERIRLIENPDNLGAAPNFNLVVREAKGGFFKWAAHDDILGPRFLEASVESLRTDPATVLTFSRVRRIDDEGHDIGTLEFDLDWRAARPSRRFGRQILVDHWCFHVFGLIRTDQLRETRLIGSYVGSDRALLAHLALLGRFHIVDEELFFHREHKGRSTKAIPRLRERRGWFDTRYTGQTSMPYWQLLDDYWKLAREVAPGRAEKLRCVTKVLRWILANRRGLWTDLREVYFRRGPS
jgi:glycosyltransferase involved in cell wall biosynthesis